MELNLHSPLARCGRYGDRFIIRKVSIHHEEFSSKTFAWRIFASFVKLLSIRPTRATSLHLAKLSDA